MPINFFRKSKSTSDQREGRSLAKGWFQARTGDVLLSSDRRQQLLFKIKRELSVTEAVWLQCYVPLFSVWAEMVQMIPASEAHHHAYEGGLLDHSLECVKHAVRIRRGYILPASEPVETTSVNAERYTYAIAISALMHDAGKLITDVCVVLGSPENQSRWVPWVGVIKPGSHYAFRFNTGRRYKYHDMASSTLLSKIVPSIGLQWLLEDDKLVGLLLAQLTGKDSLSGALGEIVRKSDRESTSQALGGTQVASRRDQPDQMEHKIGLHEQLLMAIRFLFTEGRLSYNKPGAAAWVTGETTWIVSKVTVEAATTHLYSEGIRSVPRSVIRVWEILSEHGVIVPNSEGKAVWKCHIHDQTQDWHQDLTMLKMKTSDIWHNERPADFNGTVTPASQAVNRQAPVETEKTSTAPDNNIVFKEIPPDGSVAEAKSPATHSLKEAVQKTDKPKPVRALGKKAEVSTSFDPGEKFLEWISQGIATKKIKFNDSKAPVHIVDGHVFLVSPAIFKLYLSKNADVSMAIAAQKTRHDDPVKHLQHLFQKLGIHIKQEGKNIIECTVKGERRSSKLRGYLLNEISTIFKDGNCPISNPYLTINEENTRVPVQKRLKQV